MFHIWWRLYLRMLYFSMFICLLCWFRIWQSQNTYVSYIGSNLCNKKEYKHHMVDTHSFIKYTQRNAYIDIWHAGCFLCMHTYVIYIQKKAKKFQKQLCMEIWKVFRLYGEFLDLSFILTSHIKYLNIQVYNRRKSSKVEEKEGS